MVDNSDAVNNSSDYSDAVIRKTRWGQVEADPTGGWVTIWHLVMDTTRVPDGRVDVISDAECGFDSKLIVETAGIASLVIATTEHAMSASYYPLTFEAFGIINDRFGIISEIEGLPRDWYAPFRSRRG